MGRVLYSGTRTGPLGSRIPGTPSKLLPSGNMSVPLPLGIDLITSLFRNLGRSSIVCNLSPAAYMRVWPSVSNTQIPDLFSIS